MFVQSANIVLGRPLSNGLIGALSARPAAALLVTPFVHLFTAGPTPITPDSVPADFTEATFVGYAAAALTLPLVGPLVIGADQLGGSNQANFIGGAVVPPGETILGYWIDEAAAAGTIMYLGETFQSPIPIAQLGDFISLDAVFAIAMALGLEL